MLIDSGASLVMTGGRITGSLTSSAHQRLTLQAVQVTGAVSLNNGGAISLQMGISRPK